MTDHAISPSCIQEVVESGLCSGCGLCQSLTGRHRLRLRMTPEGRLRPMESQHVSPAVLQHILSVCPGVRVGAMPSELLEESMPRDPVWGSYRRLMRGWAGDPEVRCTASSGGVLSALAIHLLESGSVDCVLHAAPSRISPLHNSPCLSRDRADIQRVAQTGYGPTGLLMDFTELLERKRPFALIGKPCDIAAVRSLARIDSRVDRYCRYFLSMLCAGVPNPGKTLAVLGELGLREEDVARLRYRGYENPGCIHIEMRDGRTIKQSHDNFWSNPDGSCLQHRCVICPDPVGISADVVAGDIWPGGQPLDEDPGCNSVIVRTSKGLDLTQSAVRAGTLVLDREINTGELNDCQPHLVRQRRSVWARLMALSNANRPVPKVDDGLGLETLAQGNGFSANLSEIRRILLRVLEGYNSEPPARPADER